MVLAGDTDFNVRKTFVVLCVSALSPRCLYAYCFIFTIRVQHECHEKTVYHH